MISLKPKHVSFVNLLKISRWTLLVIVSFMFIPTNLFASECSTAFTLKRGEVTQQIAALRDLTLSVNEMDLSQEEKLSLIRTIETGNEEVRSCITQSKKCFQSMIYRAKFDDILNRTKAAVDAVIQGPGFDELGLGILQTIQRQYQVEVAPLVEQMTTDRQSMLTEVEALAGGVKDPIAERQVLHSKIEHLQIDLATLDKLGDLAFSTEIQEKRAMIQSQLLESTRSKQSLDEFLAGANESIVKTLLSNAELISVLVLDTQAVNDQFKELYTLKNRDYNHRDYIKIVPLLTIAPRLALFLSIYRSYRKYKHTSSKDDYSYTIEFKLKENSTNLGRYEYSTLEELAEAAKEESRGLQSNNFDLSSKSRSP